ncbi:MAG: hypothetical protein KF889_25425 [Alphaproteobacteria bacterium]|nr:hypothetical protein [Alphaproteobacteria bacterium]MCW5739665.1 hypothetical protein [Alphaproteobacteria bacterium]
MAAIGTTALTLADHAKRSDPDGKISKIVELLGQTNEILTDMLWMEGNLPTGHRTTVRTGLPSATWRLLNYGVPKTKSTTAQVDDACGMLEVYSEIDKALADLNGNTAEFRLSEDRAFIEGMNQQLATALFYGNQATNPERITGLEPRYNLSTAGNGTNVIKAGGSGSDNTSIWLVVWGDQSCHGIFPKGSKAGLQHNDKGQQTVLDAAGNQYEAYRTHFKWDAGLTLRDWRYVVRICNIDLSDIAGSTPINLMNYMIRAINKIPMMGMGRPVFYMNRAMRTWFDIQAINKTTLALKFDEIDGKQRTSFQGIPLRTCDAILNTESTVS